MKKRAVFIGRWSPFHQGHLALMQGKIDAGIPLLIMVRDTPYDEYPVEVRKKMIESVMAKMSINAKVMVIDDIESINYGRDVGYEVNAIEVPDNVKGISATNIREKINCNDETWKHLIVPGADDVLSEYLLYRRNKHGCAEQSVSVLAGEVSVRKYRQSPAWAKVSRQPNTKSHI